ncbi:MAG: ArnT family glycosyltransferase [Planctomycetota bacterium]
MAKAAHHLLVHEPDHREALWEGRILLLIFPLLGIAAAFALAWRVGGPTAATISALFMTLDPNLLFHGHLITTDVPLTALLLAGAWACESHLHRPRALTLLGVWVVVASAILVKFNGLVALVYLVALGLNRGKRGLMEATGGLVFGWLMMVLMYGAGFSGWIPPAYLEGLRYVGEHAGGRTVFLDGVAGAGSFPLHALASVVAKTPVWLLVAATAGLFTGAMKQLRPLAIVALLCFVASLASPLNLGVRHCLPWMGLLWVASGLGLAQALRNRTLIPVSLTIVGSIVIFVMLGSRLLSQSKLGQGLWEMTGPGIPLFQRIAPGLILLVVGLAGLRWKTRFWVPLMGLLPLSILLMSPRGYAGFDSRLVGGGLKGFVSDSNIDWGQDFVRLGRFLDNQGIREARVWLFGLDVIPTNANLYAFPASYDTIRFQGLSDTPMMPGDYLVVSEHVLALPSSIMRYALLAPLRHHLSAMERIDTHLDSLRLYRLPPALVDSSSTHAR